jgi:hypothetical protein
LIAHKTKLDHCPFNVEVATVQGLYIDSSPLDGKPYASLTALDGLARIYLNSDDPAAFVAALRSAADRIEDQIPPASSPDDAPPTTAAQDIKRLLELRAAKDDHEAALKPIVAEIDKLSERILERWAEEGTSSQKVNGKLVSLRCQKFATVVDGNYEAAAAALKAAGLEHLLRANTQTLSAWMREREENGLSQPPEFEGVIGTYERYSLSVRKG